MKRYKVYVNGRLVPAEKAAISVFDAAYLYGEGLFETLLAIDGGIPFLSDHLKRLARGAKALGLSLPISAAGLQEAIYKTLDANRLKDAYVRVNLSAEEADVGRRQRRIRDVHVVIFAKPPDPYPKKLYKTGCRLIVVRSLPNDPVGVADIKTTNYLVKVLARREVATRRADEGILLNTRGHVTEGAGSNIFLLRRGRLYTPPISEGVMPGVTRKWVLCLARKEGLRCEERVLTLRALEAADEVFITSTLKGIMPVAFIERRRVARVVPGPGTRQVTKAYQDLLRMKSSRK